MFNSRWYWLPLWLAVSQLSLAEDVSVEQSSEKNPVQPSYKLPTAKEAVKHYNVDRQEKALLSSVTVTANSTLADELLSPKSVTIYSRDTIARSGAGNLLDFFKYSSEIMAEPNFGSPINPALSMRGFGSGDGYQNLKIIVDGLSLNQIDMVPQQIGSVPVDSVEKIEVVKSAGTVLYGDNAAAGTIIIRSNNSFDRKPFYGSLRSGFGSYNTKLEHINLGSVRDFGGVKLLADGNFTYLDGEGKKPVLPDGTRDTIENLNGKATLGLQAGNLELVGSYLKDDSNVVYTGSMSLDAFNRNPDAAVLNGNRNIVRIEDWLINLKYRFNDRLNAAYSYANKIRDSKYPAFNYVPHYEGDDHRFTLQAIQDDFIVLAGFDINRSSRENAGETTAKENVAGFISADVFLTDRLTLNTGFRQAFITFAHDNDRLNSHLARTVNPSSVDAALNYSLTRSNALFASYSHAFQSPDIDRFFLPIYDADFRLTGSTFNAFINTMETDTYSVGFKHLEDDLKIKAEFFYSDLNNEIYYNSSTFTNTNFDSSRKLGIDLSLYKDFGLFFASANYLFTDTRAEVGSQAYRISAQPKHIVLATLGKQFAAPRLPLPYHTISLSHKYQSNSYPDGDFDNSLGKQQAYNATMFNYQLTDRKHWTVDFSIQNLFNGSNGQFVDFGGSRPVVYPTNYQRTFQGSVTYRF